MNFQSIKTKFILHLKEITPSSEWGQLESDLSDESIFLHQDEFKQFLKDEYNIEDGSLTTISVLDILKMNIVDGKLVDMSETAQEDETVEEGENENTDQTEPTEETVENGWLAGFINDLFGNKTYKDFIDADKNEEINEEELTNFLNYIKDLDGNGENLSLDDMFKTLESMKEGTFKIPSSETETTEETPEAQTQEDTSSQSTSSSGGSYDSGSGSYNSGSNSSNTGNNTDVPDANTPKSYDSMTEDELNQELTSNQSELETNQAVLNAISSGTYTEDSELNQLKTNMDTKYEAYKAALSPEMQEKLDTITTSIAQVETNISLKETEITNQNIAISSAETAYNSSKATYESYKAAVDELEAKDTSSLTQEQKTDLNTKIANAKAKRDAAEADITVKKAAWDEEQNKLTQLNQELADLKTGENGLESLNAQKQELENEIKTENPSAEALMTAYNDAKAAYDARKAALKSAATTAVEASQKSINDINTAKQNLADKTDIDTNYSFSSTGELFDPNAKLSMQYIEGKNGSYDYMLIAPDDVKPNEELPVLVFLHGDGQSGRGEKNLWQQYCPPGIMKNWSMNNFRGYILCPVLPNRGDDWTNDKSETALRTMLTQFGQTHKINEKRISLTGGSRGGMGTVYMASHMGDVFYRAAAISAYNSGVTPSDVNIPLRGYYGSNDAGGSKKYMKNNFSAASLTVLQGADHSGSPKAAFTQDLDGDNCSDLIEWLFSDEPDGLVRT